MRRATQAFASLAAVFRNEQLRRLELAWGGSITAEWAHFVALGVFAYQTGGATAVGVVGLIRMLPAAIVAPFAAFLGDRFPRERFLLAIAALGTASLAGSAIVVAADAGATPVYALAGVFAVASTLVRPAHQALLPSLSRTPEELIASNGASSTLEGLGALIGPLVGGLLLATTGVAETFAAAACANGLAILFLARVHPEGAFSRPAGSTAGAVREVVAGYAYLARERAARLIVLLMAAQTFVRGAVNVLIVVAAFRLLGGDEATVGILTAAIGAGGLVGALGGMTLVGRHLAAPFGIALVFWGLPLAALAPLHDAWPAFVCLLVVGAANSVEDVAGFTLLQRIVDDEVLTRVLGALWGLAMAGVAVGSVAASGLVAVIGAREALLVVACVLPVLTVLSWRRLVAIDRAAEAPLAELELLRQVPMFAPLSVAAKEGIARNLLRLSAPAGADVIREGDVGDRFYILVDGEAEVVKGGRRVIARGPGDYFGEIALLRGVPRTATVRTLTPVELLAIEGQDFLAAVTGHSSGLAAGEEVVSRRLRWAG
jgi:CRP-like cAMP-binding protein